MAAGLMAALKKVIGNDYLRVILALKGEESRFFKDKSVAQQVRLLCGRR